jgi:hypothetical protein
MKIVIDFLLKAGIGAAVVSLSVPLFYYSCYLVGRAYNWIFNTYDNPVPVGFTVILMLASAISLCWLSGTVVFEIFNR